MQFVLIIHEVDDYAAWKSEFDAAAEIRSEAGELTYPTPPLTFEAITAPIPLSA